MREDEATSTTDSLAGRRVGSFVLREAIAAGGFGTIYRAEDPLCGRDVAIKLCGHASPAERARLWREARFASRLSHPLALHVYGYGAEPDGTAWMAMELVRGPSMKHWIETHGAMPLGAFADAFECVCDVLDHAHERGIVHGDVKASNILIVPACGRLWAKLVDFGCATCAGDTDELDGAPGFARGSPRYMAPEQWDDPRRIDRAVDVYASGVVAYEALTGRPPFVGRTPRALSLSHAFAPVPPLGPGFPPALDDVIASAMAKRPDDRYRTAGALAAAVRRVAEASCPR